MILRKNHRHDAHKCGSSAHNHRGPDLSESIRDSNVLGRVWVLQNQSNNNRFISSIICIADMGCSGRSENPEVNLLGGDLQCIYRREETIYRLPHTKNYKFHNPSYANIKILGVYLVYPLPHVPKTINYPPLSYLCATHFQAYYVTTTPPSRTN